MSSGARFPQGSCTRFAVFGRGAGQKGPTGRTARRFKSPRFFWVSDGSFAACGRDAGQFSRCWPEDRRSIPALLRGRRSRALPARHAVTACGETHVSAEAPHRENWPARRPADKAREGGIPSVFRPKRNDERRAATLFGRDGSPAVSGAGRQHRVDPGAEGTGGGVTRPPFLLARERRVGFTTGGSAGMDRRSFPERGASTA